MEKFKLGELNLGKTEVLTKQQMKKVIGGLSSTPECYDDACQGRLSEQGG